jgi:glycolate oxidase FAD binding subunit
MPVGALQERLAQEGQWLTLDSASVAEGASVGGMLAPGDAGPRRHLYGTMRDLAIGASVVLADGTVAHSGGRVIKNVAGYDLTKLFTGSLGTLGMVTEVSLRLHPLPAASATVRLEASAGVATGLVLDLLGTPVVLSALDWSGGFLWARLEGTRAGVRGQASTVVKVAARAGASAEVLQGGSEDVAWAELALGSHGVAGEVVARAATPPDRLGRVAESLHAAADSAGVGARLTSHAGLGLHTARLSDAPLDSLAAVLGAWRSAVEALGGTVVIRRGVPCLAELVSTWGPAPSSVELMRRVKAALDPEGRMAPGRFAPWW